MGPENSGPSTATSGPSDRTAITAATEHYYTVTICDQCYHHYGHRYVGSSLRIVGGAGWSSGLERAGSSKERRSWLLCRGGPGTLGLGCFRAPGCKSATSTSGPTEYRVEIAGTQDVPVLPRAQVHLYLWFLQFNTHDNERG